MSSLVAVATQDEDVPNHASMEHNGALDPCPGDTNLMQTQGPRGQATSVTVQSEAACLVSACASTIKRVREESPERSCYAKRHQRERADAVTASKGEQGCGPAPDSYSPMPYPITAPMFKDSNTDIDSDIELPSCSASSSTSGFVPLSQSVSDIGINDTQYAPHSPASSFSILSCPDSPPISVASECKNPSWASRSSSNMSWFDVANSDSSSVDLAYSSESKSDIAPVEVGDVVAPRKSRPENGMGVSSSARASRKLKASMQSGAFCPNNARLANFERAVHDLDEAAEFQYRAKWKVYHSACSRWITCKEAYSVTCFRSHVKTCKASSKNTSNAPRRVSAKPRQQATHAEDLRETATIPRLTHTLDFYTSQLGWTKSELGERCAGFQTTQKSVDPPTDTFKLGDIPCGGITESHALRVKEYIRRTGAFGGGARSVTAIAKDLYGGRSYGELSGGEKTVVKRQQGHEQKWHIDHIRNAVFTTQCKHSISRPQLKLSGHSVHNVICPSCLAVLNSKQFKMALRVPVPNPEHYKYLNYQYRADDLGYLYARTAGLQELFEDSGEVSSIHYDCWPRQVS